MPPAPHFRWASAGDSDVLADIMFDAVRNGESLYSEQQREAWVPARRSGEDWVARLQGQDIVVAEQDGQAVGFASLAEGGYIDFAYIRPKAQHTGLSGSCFRALRKELPQSASLCCGRMRA
jgi:putative acetyltransferase